MKKRVHIIVEKDRDYIQKEQKNTDREIEIETEKLRWDTVWNRDCSCRKMRNREKLYNKKRQIKWNRENTCKNRKHNRDHTTNGRNREKYQVQMLKYGRDKETKTRLVKYKRN